MASALDNGLQYRGDGHHRAHSRSASPPEPTEASAGDVSSTGNGASSQGQSFRRQRAARACETCHARKVRCDATSLGCPCTNCVAFQIDCKIPPPKRKKGARAASKDSDSDREHATDDVHSPRLPPKTTVAAATDNTTVYHNNSQKLAAQHTIEGTPSNILSPAQAHKQEVDNQTYVKIVNKPKFTRAPIKEAGRVAYLGESSNLTLLVHDRQGSSDVVHYPLPDNVRGSRARLTELDNEEIEILHTRGAFLLPPRSLCDELIESYFRWIHPIVPVINRKRFLAQYRDPENPPSLLLLQAMLLAGSRVCTTPRLMDANGSTTPAALTFYKRAKALYDANYEDDRVTIVQSLLLMGWYWEGPEDVTKNVFYWSRVAIIVAQGSGMHRSVEDSQLKKTDKRLWKRIWWTLFTRDRSVAVALGRPVHINLDDCDVEMLTEDDFIEDEDGDGTEDPTPPDSVHVHFFLQYVKLCELMGLVLSQQYSVADRGRPVNAIDLQHCDTALADWLRNCPKVMVWDARNHHFWAALLHANYYTTLCLLHRAHMPPGSGSHQTFEVAPYSSRTIAFTAAAQITAIMEKLSSHGELRFCPAFIVYSVFSALIMHVYQTKSPFPAVREATRQRMATCMSALADISQVWLVGKMVHTLFESILGNKNFEERLQKAAGRRHGSVQQSMARLEQHSLEQQQQARQNGASQSQQQQQQHQHQHQQQQQQHVSQNGRKDGHKRKFEDMNIDFALTTPTPQESYERSRPQTPSQATIKFEPPPQPGMMAPPGVTSPGNRFVNDPFLPQGSSRPVTRPVTPFASTFSALSTPPDLYLVTRNSPNIGESVWANFQPDHLFPENTALPMLSPTQMNMNLDPNLVPLMSGDRVGQQSSSFARTPMGGQNMNGQGAQGANGQFGQMPLPQQQQQNTQQQQQQQQNNHNVGQTNGRWGVQFDAMDGQSPESWSSGSALGQPVPATLNVEDWFQFFGINGDLNNVNFDMPRP